MQMDSLPIEIDEIERRILHLEIERRRLLHESMRTRKKPEAARGRVGRAREESKRAQGAREVEKDAVAKIRKLKEQIEQLKAEEQRLERAGDLARVAEIRYGKLGTVERELGARAEKSRGPAENGGILKEEVGEEDIAKLVSKWTGIPWDVYWRGETQQKLVTMESRLRQRVIGKTPRSNAWPIPSGAIARGSRSNRPIGSFIFLGPTGVGKPSWRALSRSFCSMTNVP